MLIVYSSSVWRLSGSGSNGLPVESLAVNFRVSLLAGPFTAPDNHAEGTSWGKNMSKKVAAGTASTTIYLTEHKDEGPGSI